MIIKLNMKCVGGVNTVSSVHHNIFYSKSPVYNSLNGPGVNIKGPCFT
jgi:hypothetical protein